LSRSRTGAVQPPDVFDVERLDVAVVRGLNQLERNDRVVVALGELAQHADAVGVRIDAVAPRRVFEEVLRDARVADARDVNRVPQIAQFVVRVEEQARRTHRVSGEERRGAVTGHGAERGFEDGLGNTRRFVADQQDVLAVDSGERFRRLWVRRAEGDEALFRRCGEMDRFRLDVEELQQLRRQTLEQRLRVGG
jgi:hypothetical protein